MSEVKRPLDEKMEAKVPPVEAKDAEPDENAETGDAPESQEEGK